MKKILIYSLVYLVAFIPVVAMAQGAGKLVPCEGADCNVDDFLTMIFYVINFVIFLGIIFSSLAFAYAGFLYITAQGDAGKVKKATKIFTGVGVGLLLAFTSFLIIQLITTSLGLDTSKIPIILK
jgi:hypothetical protein